MLRRKGHHVVVAGRAASQATRREERGLRVYRRGPGTQPLCRRTVGLWCRRPRPATSSAPPDRSTTSPAAYAAATVVVSAATQPEGLQRAILEAQAMARPVIISDAGAGADSVLATASRDRRPDDRDCGSRPPMRRSSPRRWCGCLSLPDSARHAIGARGRAWVTGRFAPEATAEPLLRLYAEVTGRTVDRRAKPPLTYGDFVPILFNYGTTVRC